MAGPVPAIHVFDAVRLSRRGCPRQARARRVNYAGPLVSLRAEELVPNRLVAQGGDEGAVREAIFAADPWRQRGRPLPPRHFAIAAAANFANLGCQDELRLPGPDQIDIDLCQQFGVE